MHPRTTHCDIVNMRRERERVPYSAKFSQAVNFADFANSNSIAKIIFVKIIIIDFLRPQLILTTNVVAPVSMS